MDLLLQNHGSKRVFPIPEGLKELTSDIIREVLRHQPECIHAFIAEYLETMVIVREKARDSAIVVSNIFRQGYFFEDLYRTKNVKREQAEAYASVIQAGWRGYVIRKKFREYLQKRRKIQEDRERKKTLKIEQYLDSIGITYEEATRAACIIQAAYRQSRRGKWVINEAGEEVWMEGETIPIGQRIREAEKLQGRWDRWEKKDWGDFFEMDEEGEIHHDWPHVGQLFKIPRDLLAPDMEVVRFYGMRDLEGREQYTYLKGPQKGRNPRGFPIGFLIPLPRELLHETSAEVTFIENANNERMGHYTYVYEKVVERPDLDQFAAILKDRKMLETLHQDFTMEEYDYDPDWVLPRILIQIRKDCLREDDDEVAFIKEELAPETDHFYTFRAETADMSLKVINRIQKSNCSDLEEAMADAGYIPTYGQAMTGRFLAAEKFQIPKYIQKVVILKESKKGDYENKDMDQFEYVFVPRKYKWPKKRGVKVENPIKIPLTRFQGYRTNYRGSAALDKSIMFIMGPMMYTPDGKPLTYHSIFWDFFGPESWYQLLCKIAERKIARLGEAEQEGEVEEEEEEGEEEEEKDIEEADEIEASVKAAEVSVEEEPVMVISEPKVTPLAITDHIEKKINEPEPTPEDETQVEEPDRVSAVEEEGEEKPGEEEAVPPSEADEASEEEGFKEQ